MIDALSGPFVPQHHNYRRHTPPCLIGLSIQSFYRDLQNVSLAHTGQQLSRDENLLCFFRLHQEDSRLRFEPVNRHFHESSLLCADERAGRVVKEGRIAIVVPDVGVLPLDVATSPSRGDRHRSAGRKHGAGEGVGVLPALIGQPPAGEAHRGRAAVGDRHGLALQVERSDCDRSGARRRRRRGRDA